MYCISETTATVLAVVIPVLCGVFLLVGYFYGLVEAARRGGHS